MYKLQGQITREFLGLRMRNFESIVFIWTQTYRKIFKSALVYQYFRHSFVITMAVLFSFFSDGCFFPSKHIKIMFKVSKLILNINIDGKVCSHHTVYTKTYTIWCEHGLNHMAFQVKLKRVNVWMPVLRSPISVCLSHCPSVHLSVYQFSIFLRNGS